MRLLTVMSGSASAAVDIKDLLEDTFVYYGKAKYGADPGRRYEIESDTDYVRIHKALCVILVCAYDICQSLSRNGFCSVSVNSSKDEGVISFCYSVKPKHKLTALIESSDSTEDAVYCLLGREAENMFMIKTLARHIRGQTDIEYDQPSDELRLSVSAPIDSSSYVKAGGAQLYDVAHIAVQTCLALRSKA